MKYLSILAVLALLTGCTNDENAPDTDSGDRVAVSLSAGIGQTSHATQTRSLNDQWTAGDSIGTQNYTLKATDKNGVFESGKSYPLAVTVNRTEASMTVSIGQWQEGGESEGDAGMEINIKY